LLLGALARLAREHPDLDLVMAGPDEEGLQPQLEAQAKELGIDRRVHWTGMLGGDLKWGAFFAAEAFVLASHQENFGIAVVEAMACEVPVLISDKVNIWPEIVQDEAGIVDADTVDGTYRSMTALLAMNAEERRRLRSNGLACFRTRYEMTRATQSLNALFTGEFRGESSGIPHLAKNERDVGHPDFSSGEEREKTDL
jgi:glycosyltransferase involved in cell wall biosynthesis